MEIKRFIIFCVALIGCLQSAASEDSMDIEEHSTGLYQIEGKVYSPEIDNNNNWQDETQIILNSGKFMNKLNRNSI